MEITIGMEIKRGLVMDVGMIRVRDTHQLSVGLFDGQHVS